MVERGNADAARCVTIAAGAKVTMRTDPGFAATRRRSFGEVDNAGTFEFVATGVATDNDVNELTVTGTFANRGTLRSAQNEGYTTLTGDVDEHRHGHGRQRAC